MYLVPDYRGKVLMEKLLQAAKAVIKEEGAIGLRLYVHKRNKRALKAYQKVGFKDCDYNIMRMQIQPEDTPN